MTKTSLRASLLSALLFFFLVSGWAQNRSITGKVTDSAGAPLSNVSIQVKVPIAALLLTQMVITV